MILGDLQACRGSDFRRFASICSLYRSFVYNITINENNTTLKNYFVQKTKQRFSHLRSVCININKSIITYIHKYINTYIHTYIHIYTYIYIYIYIYIYLYICLYICIYIYIFIYVHLYRPICTCAYTLYNIHSYIQTHNIHAIYS